MPVKVSFRQCIRTPLRLVSNFLVMTLVCAFLSVSLNLRQTAHSNIQLLNEEFDVVAIPTFKGLVNASGQLVQDTSGYYRYKEAQAEDFDLSILRDAPGVKNVLIHKQLGAYLNSDESLYPGSSTVRNTDDVFIFTYNGTEPATFATRKQQAAKITLEWSARGYHELPTVRSTLKIYNTVGPYEVQYRWPEVIADLGLADMWPENEEGTQTGAFILQPGQRYIASGSWSFITHSDANRLYVPGMDEPSQVSIKIDEGHSKHIMLYEGNEGAYYIDADYSAYHLSYPCILPYTEDFWETGAGAYFQDAIDICRVNGNALTAVTTEDLSLYRPFYNGGVYVEAGRSFTAADYENGNRVCLVSAYLAQLNGWQLGDTLDLSFFEAQYGFSSKASAITSYYEPLVETYHEATGAYTQYIEDRFIDGGAYEIIGFYAGKVVTNDTWYGDVQYPKDTGIDCRVVIVPENSVSSLPEVPLSQYNTIILLDDEQVTEFMSAMEDTGLLELQDNQYKLKFDIYDQGLGTMKQSLRQLDTVSRLTVYLAVAAAVVVVLLLAVLTVLQNRRQIATLRSLGVKKRQLPAVVLSGLLLVCLLGAVLGGVLGHTASDRVATYILDTAQADLADTSFSAMLVKDAVKEEDPYEIAIQSRPETALSASAAVWLSLTLLCCVLVRIEGRRSPMLTLGARE